MRQLGMGFALFTVDNNDMYPPAGWQDAAKKWQISWDSWINKYIGGHAVGCGLERRGDVS